MTNHFNSLFENSLTCRKYFIELLRRICHVKRMDALWKFNILLGVLISMHGISYVAAKDTFDFKCPVGKFKCASEKCISSVWTCDGDDDCGDGSDEISCNHQITCRPDLEFTCQNRKCIPHNWACDSEKDCSDGTDEDNCPSPTCQPNFFQCNNSRCIPDRWKCDLQDDCGDRSDETSCAGAAGTCQPNEFKCTDRVCISSSWECDGDTDCADGSDEKNCSRKSTTCSTSEFACKNKHCIPKAWKCDGNKDCHDGSDEEFNCTSCGPIFWSCANGDCIKKDWQCDGEEDCVDKSDEKACSSITCPAAKFGCKDKKQCIAKSARCDGKKNCNDGSDEHGCVPSKSDNCGAQDFICSKNECVQKSQVCDGHRDCLKGEDEPISCYINECKVNNGHCTHNCTDLKIHYKCSCRKGYVLEDDHRTCIDLDECKIYGSCHQRCNNTKGHYKCSCAEGYLLEGDKKTCRARGEREWIYFSNRVDIRKLTADGMDYKVVVGDLRGVVSIDFDIKKNHIYWTDILSDTIQQANINEENSTRTILRHLHTPDGLAVDWINDKLYWTDTGYKTIEVADLDGKYNADIVNIGVNEPRAISLDPYEGYIYWTDWGTQATIERISMDGFAETREKLIDKHIFWPNGLTLDLIQRKLYWVDAKLQRIEVADLNGANRKLLKQTGFYHPFALDNFEDKLYWTDWKSDKLNRISKFDTSDVGTVKDGLYAPMDIKVYHQNRQPPGKSICGKDNNGCSHLCLLGIRNGHLTAVCKCPRNMTLSGKKCKGTHARRTPVPTTTTGFPATLKLKTSQLTKQYISTENVTSIAPVVAKTKEPAKERSQSTKRVKSPDVKVGTIVAIIISATIGIILACALLLYLRRRNLNKGHVMYYKDMSTTPLEDDFDIVNEDTDDKAKIIPEYIA